MNLRLQKSEVAAVTRLFSPALIRDLATHGESPLFARLTAQSGLADHLPVGANIHDFFELGFRELARADRRCHYVYLAAIVRNVLLGRHSLRSATILTEFRVGRCRADAVLLNGAAVAYEIKSERDSLDRLNQQVETYRRAFAGVNVIAADCHVRDVLASTSSDIGVLRLNARRQVSIERSAKVDPSRIEPVLVFDSLQRAEAEQILALNRVAVPELPNTQLHTAMREQFRALGAAQVHEGMVAVLKRSRSARCREDVLMQLPPSLAAAALTSRLDRNERDRLAAAMRIPIATALMWR